MSLNRLRNVAVRIRPLADHRPHEPEMHIREDEPSPVVQPRRPMLDDDAPASRRQIWDLETDDSPRARSAPPKPAVSARADPRPAEVQLDPTSATNPSSGRAKTRMLGFHSQDLAADAFDATDAADEGPQLPAGFLVVVDGPGLGAYYAVTTRVSSIGRDADQDVALDFGDASISRQGHASVVYDIEQNRFFLGHGNKANVVRRNGTPVLTTEEMTHGDTIKIGKTSLRFHAFCDGGFTWSDTGLSPNRRGNDE